MSGWGWRVLGFGVCLAASSLLSILFHGTPLKSFLPFLFLRVIFFVALRFGSAPGIQGTIGAAIVFAEFLFEPMFSLRVSDSVQPDHLIWMLIIGIAASEILGVQPKRPGRTKDPSEV
jgi:K+-sensing histidine kinase KdpD